MYEQTVLIVGEVFIDTHLDIIDENGPLVRLGGIFHSARAFASLGIDYALAYYAPDYLDEDINYWSLYLKTKGCHKLGMINRAPNVMLVNESKEAGNQGYYNIIKDLKMLSGNQAIAIDRHLFKFLELAGIFNCSYHEASQIYIKAAELMGVDKYELDRKIWKYMSKTNV